MGGAVVVDAVARKLITSLTGVVVLDVVEGIFSICHDYYYY
jgi:hypothetical protein